MGQTVEIMVTVTAIEGRRYTFALRAVDASNDVIGEGTHTRVVVNRQRFLEGLKKQLTITLLSDAGSSTGLWVSLCCNPSFCSRTG